MEDKTINQNGQTPIYIEKNSGQIYVGNLYVEEPSVAFVKGSTSCRTTHLLYNLLSIEKRLIK